MQTTSGACHIPSGRYLGRPATVGPGMTTPPTRADHHAAQELGEVAALDLAVAVLARDGAAVAACFQRLRTGAHSGLATRYFGQQLDGLLADALSRAGVRSDDVAGTMPSTVLAGHVTGLTGPVSYPSETGRVVAALVAGDLDPLRRSLGQAGVLARAVAVVGLGLVAGAEEELRVLLEEVRARVAVRKGSGGLTCGRCGIPAPADLASDAAGDWSGRWEGGRLVLVLCPSCQTPVEAGAAEANAAEIAVMREDGGQFVPDPVVCLTGTLDRPGDILYGADHLKRVAGTGRAENLLLFEELPAGTCCVPIVGGVMIHRPRPAA